MSKSSVEMSALSNNDIQKLNEIFQLLKADTKFHGLIQVLLDHTRGFGYEPSHNGEENVIKKVKELVPNDSPTIFDVGAYTGDYAHLIRKHLPYSKIHCFEISQKTFETLRLNLFGENITLNKFGLSDNCRKGVFKDRPNGQLNTLILKNTWGDDLFGYEMADCLLITGEIYCLANRIDMIDFLKIDCEGHELNVLFGFSEMFRSRSIRMVQFEYGYVNGDNGHLMRDFFNFFSAYGYLIGRIKNGSIKFTDFRYEYNDFKSGPNFLAVHSEDEIALKKFGE